MPEIIAIGEPLGEFNQTKAGEPQYLFGHGGDTSNAIIAAARSGASTGYITAVGDDSFGRSFLDLWQREGVDISGVKLDRSAHTGLYFISHGPDGHEFSYLRQGSAASRLTSADLPGDMIRKARVLHVSGISQAISDHAADAVFEAMQMARAAGVAICYDTNLRLRLWPLERARSVINAATAMADIVRPGLDDARHLTGLDDPDAIADFYLTRGSRIVAMTLGKEGALIATQDKRDRVPSITVNAVDATGAGDCFGGAFLAEWLMTGDPFKAAAYATVAAALSTTGFGAVAPLPTRAEVVQAMRTRGVSS